ncbi:MAG TPA: DUF4251 domain-containing protein [Bacteroidales bacterium]|nr:DUF4251 domain-containing protein [Bacteroidales bacterium]
MKTKKIIFILYLAVLAGITTIGKSQDAREDKISRKEAEKARMTYNFYALDSLLVSRRYVLEADYLQNKIGDRISVSNTLNFVRVEDEKGVLQTGSDMLVGNNGFGGVTTEGNISKYKIQRNLKSLTHRVSFNLVSNLGIFNIDMSIRADNFASATITSTRSGRLTWHGHLASLNHTRTFKGMDLY